MVEKARYHFRFAAFDMFGVQVQLLVQAGIDNLPDRCGEVVRLRKVQGFSTREVADQLGVGKDTVEKQMTLGMRALVDFMLGGSGKIVRTKARDKNGKASKQ